MVQLVVDEPSCDPPIYIHTGRPVGTVDGAGRAHTHAHLTAHAPLPHVDLFTLHCVADFPGVQRSVFNLFGRLATVPSLRARTWTFLVVTTTCVVVCCRLLRAVWFVPDLLCLVLDGYRAYLCRPPRPTATCHHACWPCSQLVLTCRTCARTRAAAEPAVHRCQLHATRDYCPVTRLPCGYSSIVPNGKCHYIP